jgi:hypothetical protein
MLVRFVRFLACPICLGTLELQIADSAAVSLSPTDEKRSECGRSNRTSFRDHSRSNCRVSYLYLRPPIVDAA